jgi:hypothetical protein
MPCDVEIAGRDRLPDLPSELPRTPQIGTAALLPGRRLVEERFHRVDV